MQLSSAQNNNLRHKIIKKIFTKKSWKFFFLSSFFSLLQAICYISILIILPLIQNIKSNPIFTNLSIEVNLVIFVIITLFICGLSLFFGLIGNKFSVQFSKTTFINLRNLVYTKIQDFSIVDIEKFSQSSLINRLTIDINNIASATEFLARVMMRSLLLYFGGLVGMLVLLIPSSISNINNVIIPEYWIIIVIVLISFGLLFIIFIISLFAFKSFHQTQVNLDNLNAVIQEDILGQRTVKSFNLQTSQERKFEVKNELLRKSSTKAGYIIATVLPTIYFFLDVSLVLATWFSNSAIVSELFSIFLLMGLMIMALVMMIVGIVQINRAIPSFKRALEVLYYEPLIQFPTTSVKLNSTNSIELCNVSFRYPSKTVNSLNNINLSINPKEVVGIIGPTGAGKSTLINLITRMYDASSGVVKIKGVDIKKMTKHQLKSQISVCPQNVILFSGTIKSNLKFGNPNANLKAMIEATQIANIYDFINAQNDYFDHKVAQRGANLSGGQKQRLAIARTIIKPSPFLIFDDSTSALDMITERKICNELLKNKLQQTIIISSQKINAIRNTNKIIVMDNGEIVAVGKHAELLRTCKYYYDIAVVQMGQKEVDDEMNK